MAQVGLTRSLAGMHGAGRADTYGAALLDVAQDHLLWLLAELGHFDDGSLIFKGGTSLRKCRIGSAGRFSTDRDFVAPFEETVLDVCAAIDGATVAGFQFALEPTRGDGCHWTLAKAEACAEKLARYRRVALGRGVYDLAQFADRRIDEPVVRRLWVLKVWGDVVDDGRGDKPLDPANVLRPRSEGEFEPESIGKLTRPVDLAAWERRARARFGFLADLDADELRWCACDPRHRREVEQAIDVLGSDRPTS